MTPMTELRDAAMTSKAWPFEEARRLLKRYEAAPPAKGHVLFETGYGPSGLPHIGTFGEVLRTTMIRRAFEVISDIPTRLICFSDDMDGMRKVPGNVPNQEMLREHLQKPLTSVPDPFGEFESFGHHNNAMLRRFLDTFGFDYEFYSATDFYASGQFDEILLRAAERYDALMKVMLKSLREERQQTYSIFLPLHPETGRVLYVPIKHVDAKDGTVTFDDEAGREWTVPVTGGSASCSGSPISARAGPRSASISRCMARTIRRTRRSTTRSARSSGRPRRNTSPMSCSSTRTGRRSPSLPATASPSTNG
jgi:lysyl-tRNA synthetase class 1